MANRFELSAIFSGVDKMTAPIRRMQSAMTAFKKSAAEPMRALGADLKTMGIAAAGAAAGITAGLTQVMSTGMNFEKTLLDAGNKFEPGIAKTSDLYKQLSVAAQDVGGKTEFSAAQSAVALNDLAGAGFTADQAISGLPKVVDFATAASLDLAQASEVATKALGAYGLKSDDPKVLADNLQLVTDTLMKTDALSSTNISGIFEAFKEGGPVAKSAGVSLQEFSAMIGVLGTAGIEGSNAGTTLKNVMLSLAKPTDEAAASLASFGIKTKDAAGNLRSPIELLGELQAKTAKLGTADKAGAFEGIFGKIPIAGVNVMLDKMGELRSQRDALNNAGGQVKLVADSKRQSSQGSWDNLTSGLEAVGLKVYEIVGGPITELIDKTTVWIGQFKDQAIPFVKEFTSSFGAGFREAWPAVKGALDILFKGFGGNQQWLGTVKDFAGVLGKVAAAGIGVAAVLGGMVGAGIQIVTGGVNLLTTAWNGTINAIGAVAFAIDDFLANTAAKWRAFSFADWGLQIVKGIAQGIRDGASFVLESLTGLAGDMVNTLRGALDMRSPSRKTAEIGMLAAAGVGVGWADQIGLVNAELARSLDQGPLGIPDRMVGAPAWSLASSPLDGGMPPAAGLPAPATAPPAVPPGPVPVELSDDAVAQLRQQLEVTIRTPSGSSAEVTGAPSGAKVNLQPSGAP